MVLHLLAVILLVGSTLAEFTRNCLYPNGILPCQRCEVSADFLFCNQMVNVEFVRSVIERDYKSRLSRLFIADLLSSRIPSHALGNIRLKHLKFVDGNISKIAEKAFLGQKDSLISLNLDRIKLKDIPTKAVQQLTSLSTLSLSGNLISEIGKNAFPVKLEELDLSGNLLKKIPDGSLDYLDTVTRLNLSGNLISEIGKNAFPIKLRELCLSGNRLTKIPDGSLDYLDTVTRLNLSGNLISEIGKNAFPVKLRELDLSGNLLSTFKGSLRSPLNLVFFNASHNKFTSMKGELEGLDHLYSLNLNHNRISDISGIFSNLLSIHELSLAGNLIREVGEALVGLNHLQHLNLAQNDIGNINPKLFENMTVLRHLDLSGNLLETIEICPIIGPSSSLRGIQLSDSSFRTLQPDCFNFFLQFVNLSSNQLSALKLPHATNLKSLDISFNDFSSLETLELPMSGSAELEMEGNRFPCLYGMKSNLKDLEASGYKFPHGFPPCLRTLEFSFQMN